MFLKYHVTVCLYRALRVEEIEAGYVLIPKGQGPFLALPRLGIDTRLPFVLGATEEHAVKQHQMGEIFQTSGISTTPHLERAKYYAKTHRVIVKISRQRLAQLGIREYVVEEVLQPFSADILVPEDDEVILAHDTDGPFPKELIDEVINLDDLDGR